MDNLADSLPHLLSSRQRNNESGGTFPSPSGGRQQPRECADLQKLLIDERLRCETHKTNYQTLKEEHKRFQDEYIRIQEELAKVQTSGVESSGQMQSLVHNLKSQLAAKSRELEEVRAQTLHPSKLEIIKAEITKDLEEPLKAHMLSMDKEVEKYRSEYNKLRYECTFLKAEYDHTKAEHQRNMEEQSLRHQALVSALQHERDDLLKNQSSITDVDVQKTLHLQRQKNQLDQRVKNLLDEMAELRKQKENAAVEADSVQRSQAKDLVRLQTNLKSIESEKMSSEIQSERLQRELKDCNDHKTRLMQQIQDLNKECTTLRNSLDEESHHHKVELTNRRLEMLKMKGDMERERDSLYNKNQDLEAELDIIRTSSANHQRELEEIERESSRRIQEAREEEWNKNNLLQNEKLQLEEKCRELEQRLAAEKSSKLSEREQNEEKMRSMEMNEMSLRSEISQLKVQLEHETQAKHQQERDREDCVALRKKLHDRDGELQSMTSFRQQALIEAERAKEAIRDVRADAEAARMQAQRAQSEAEKSIEVNKVTAMEEKHRLQTRLDQLEHKMKRNAENQEKTNKQQKKLKHSLIEKVKHLKGKNQLLEAEKEKLEIELKAGRHGVTAEEHNRLRRRMRDLVRRHNEFKRVIGSAEGVPVMTSTFNKPFDDMTSFNLMGVTDMTNLTTGSAVEKEHRKELSMLKKRLDEVAMRQNEQLQALEAVTTTVNKSHNKENDAVDVNMDAANHNSGVDTEDDMDESESKASGSGRYEYEDDFTSHSSVSAKS